MESQWKANFDVTMAANYSASWVKLAADMQKHLTALSGTKAGIPEGHFDRIVFVMGSVEIPKTSARQATWSKMADSVRSTLQGALKFLSPDQVVEG